MSIFDMYEQAWQSIICPDRHVYDLHHLGPNSFVVDGQKMTRTDFQLFNKRSQRLECSFYHPQEMTKPLPCVVYLHASGCSRLEACHYINNVLSNNMCYFSFDFSGCGKSAGAYTTLGYFEQDDVECVLDWLKNSEKTTKIALWGRSMGAATAVFFSANYHKADVLILDSCYTSIKNLIMELANTKASVPHMFTPTAYSLLRNTIMEKVGLDIKTLKPIHEINKITCPILFGYSDQDDFVGPQHSQALIDAFSGCKQFMTFPGGHNATRPVEWAKTVLQFIKRYIPDDVVAEEPAKNSIYVPVEAKIRKISADAVTQNHHNLSANAADQLGGVRLSWAKEQPLFLNNNNNYNLPQTQPDQHKSTLGGQSSRHKRTGSHTVFYNADANNVKPTTRADQSMISANNNYMRGFTQNLTNRDISSYNNTATTVPTLPDQTQYAQAYGFIPRGNGPIIASHNNWPSVIPSQNIAVQVQAPKNITLNKTGSAGNLFRGSAPVNQNGHRNSYDKGYIRDQVKSTRKNSTSNQKFSIAIDPSIHAGYSIANGINGLQRDSRSHASGLFGNPSSDTGRVRNRISFHAY